MLFISENEWVPVSPKRKNQKQKSKPEPKKMFIPAKEVLHNQPLPLVVPSLVDQMAAQQAAAAAAQTYDPNAQPYDPLVQAAAAYDPSIAQTPSEIVPLYNNVPPTTLDPTSVATQPSVAGAEALAQAQCAQVQYPVQAEQESNQEGEQQDSVFPPPPSEVCKKINFQDLNPKIKITKYVFVHAAY